MFQPLLFCFSRYDPDNLRQVSVSQIPISKVGTMMIGTSKCQRRLHWMRKLSAEPMLPFAQKALRGCPVALVLMSLS